MEDIPSTEKSALSTRSIRVRKILDSISLFLSDEPYRGIVRRGDSGPPAVAEALDFGFSPAERADVGARIDSAALELKIAVSQGRAGELASWLLED